MRVSLSTSESPARVLGTGDDVHLRIRSLLFSLSISHAIWGSEPTSALCPRFTLEVFCTNAAETNAHTPLTYFLKARPPPPSPLLNTHTPLQWRSFDELKLERFWEPGAFWLREWCCACCVRSLSVSLSHQLFG